MKIDRSLADCERLIEEATISKVAIIITWISVPALLIFCFGVTYLPGLIRYAVHAKLRETLMQQLGVTELGFGDVFSAVAKDVFGAAAPFLIGVGIFFSVVLGLVWLVWALVTTRRIRSYALVCTDFRVIGKTKAQELAIPYPQLKNVFLGSSVWGRWFGYGELTLQSDKGSITVKNIAHAENIRRFLMSKIEEACGT